MPQDTFMNMSASIPEPVKPFDGLGHSYTPEEYLQQVEARLTFAIGEEPQNNPIKDKSWHNILTHGLHTMFINRNSSRLVY